MERSMEQSMEHSMERAVECSLVTSMADAARERLHSIRLRSRSPSGPAGTCSSDCRKVSKYLDIEAYLVAYLVVTCIVMACIVMAHLAMAYEVMKL